MLVLRLALPHRQRGVSLVELLITVVVGVVVSAGIVAIYGNTSRRASENLDHAHLHQELSAVMNIIVNDLRRSGYTAVQAFPGATAALAQQVQTLNGTTITFSPFWTDLNDLRTGNYAGEASNSCILYTYNLDDDRSPPRVGVCAGCTPTSAPFNQSTIYDTDNVEMFGFRLQTGALWMRRGLTDAAESTYDCNSGSWERITDTDMIEITQLQFSVQSTLNRILLVDLNNNDTCDKLGSNFDICIDQQIRAVTIVLSGRIRRDPLLQQTITNTVTIRNDSYIQVKVL